MRPNNKPEIKEIDTNIFTLNNENNNFLNVNQKDRTFAQIVESNRLISLFTGFCLLLFIFYIFHKKDFIRLKYC